MSAIKTGLASILLILFPATSLLAQQSGHMAEPSKLPDQCLEALPENMPDMHQMMMQMPQMPPMGDANRAMMEGMMKTQPGMMQGMMAENPDVAFVCGMIMHHQGAIEMAKAELENGKDETIKQMAQKIIDDQTREIEEFKGWLEKRTE